MTAVIVWFFKYFNFHMVHVEDVSESMLADIGRFLLPVFRPLGVRSWQIIAALLTSYVAKDNMLNTMGQILSADMADSAVALSAFEGLIDPAGAVGLLMFFVLSSPCFATMGAMHKELGSRKEAAKAIGFQMGTAYLAALIAYQVLRFVL